MKVHASFTIWMEAKPLLALKEKGKQREVMKAGRKWKAKEKVQIKGQVSRRTGLETKVQEAIMQSRWDETDRDKEQTTEIEKWER